MQGYRITVGRLPRPHEAAPIQKWLTENLNNGFELVSVLPTADTGELWYLFRLTTGQAGGSGEFREFADFSLDS